jgi:hypothetical protein
LARRKSWQPKHEVDLSLKARDISKLGAAVTFRVKSAGEMLGTIEIGQGGFRWKARNGKFFRRISWARFFEKLERA